MTSVTDALLTTTLDPESETDLERGIVNDRLQNVFSLVQSGCQYASIRAIFAELRKWRLDKSEIRQLKVAIRQMPLAERPVYLPSRAEAIMLGDTYGLNTDEMNRGMFRQFVFGLIDGSIPAYGYPESRHLLCLSEYLKLDVLMAEDGLEFLVTVIKKLTECLGETLPPAGIDEEQQLALKCIEQLRRYARQDVGDAFEALADVVMHCLQHGLYERETAGSTTSAQWRGGPVLIAAFDAIFRLTKTDDGLTLWGQSQVREDLCWWKAELLSNEASAITMDSFNMLLLDS